MITYQGLKALKIWEEELNKKKEGVIQGLVKEYRQVLKAKLQEVVDEQAKCIDSIIVKSSEEIELLLKEKALDLALKIDSISDVLSPFSEIRITLNIPTKEQGDK